MNASLYHTYFKDTFSQTSKKVSPKSMKHIVLHYCLHAEAVWAVWPQTLTDIHMAHPYKSCHHHHHHHQRKSIILQRSESRGRREQSKIPCQLPAHWDNKKIPASPYPTHPIDLSMIEFVLNLSGGVMKIIGFIINIRGFVQKIWNLSLIWLD